MVPRNVHCDLKCLSKQYLPFQLPITGTALPYDPQGPALKETLENGETRETSAEDVFKRYCVKMADLSDKDFDNVLLATLHGECRILTSGMSIDDINDQKEMFHKNVVLRVQGQLLKEYGVSLSTLNIAEIMETKREGQLNYLEARERKQLSRAVEQSNADVAEATKNGQVIAKERQTELRQEQARLEALAVAVEYKAKEQIALAGAQLYEVNAEAKRRKEVAEFEGAATAQKVKEERQNEVEKARAEQTLSAQRAILLTKEKVAAECRLVAQEAAKKAGILDAEAKVAQVELEAKANLRKGKWEAEVMFAKLEAEANGAYLKGNAEARAKQDLLEAQAKGTQQLIDACKGDVNLARPIMELYANLPQKVAEESAKAVQNLHPSLISVSGDDPATLLAKTAAGFLPVWKMLKAMNNDNKT